MFIFGWNLFPWKINGQKADDFQAGTTSRAVMCIVCCIKSLNVKLINLVEGHQK